MSYSEFVLNQIRKGIAEEKNPNPMSSECPTRRIKKMSLNELDEWERKTHFKYAKGVPPSPATEHFLGLTIRKRNYTGQCWMNLPVNDLRFGHPQKELAMAASRIVDHMRREQERNRYRPGTQIVFCPDTWLTHEWRQHVERYVFGEFTISQWSGRASPTNNRQVPMIQYTPYGKKPKSPLVF